MGPERVCALVSFVIILESKSLGGQGDVIMYKICPAHIMGKQPPPPVAKSTHTP